MARKVLCFLMFSLLVIAEGFPNTHLASASTLFIGTEKEGEYKAFIILDLSKTTNFSLRYIHSVDKLPVEEFFDVGQDNEIYLVGIRFVQLPYLITTLPHETNLSYTYSPPWIKVENLNRKIGSIKIRVSSFTQQCLVYEGVEVKLFNIFEQGQLVIIRVESDQRDEVVF